MYQVQDKAHSRNSEYSWGHILAKSVSTNISSLKSWLGCKIRPLSLVANRYRPMRLTTNSCKAVGLEEYRAH
jgi:hypothetical protein